MQDRLRVIEVFTDKYAGWRNCYCNCGNALVAHGSIDAELTSEGTPIALDKSYTELNAAKFSMLAITNRDDSLTYLPPTGNAPGDSVAAVMYGPCDSNYYVIVTADGAMAYEANEE